MAAVNTVDVIILAAGRSSRFGSDKRLLTLQPLLKTITQAFAGSEYRLLCVLQTSDKANLPRLLGDFQQDAHVVPIWNPEPEQGMGGSLALAAQQLQADVAMVLLADMPFVKPETLLKVLQKADSSHITAPVFQGRRGHPVCFGRDFFAGLQQLAGDHGARDLIAQHASQLIGVDTDDKGVILDIDTPADWQQAQHVTDSPL
jgi:molybdenum cofactor cytidylyltransferase